MIHYAQGDIFETEADIRVNTVNCVGVMGAGVALAFKTIYPAMFKEYKTKCNVGHLKPGKIDIWKPLTGEWVINFPTKRHWRQPSRMEDIEAGLKDLRNYLSEQGKVKVALPALGCGHGALEWNAVLGKIKAYLSNLEAEILVFEPSASHAAGRKAVEGDESTLEELHRSGVQIIEPGHKEYPSQLKGRSAAVLYIKGQSRVLERNLFGILPSSKPAEREMEAARACVELIAKPGITLFTGYSPAIERPMIRMALDNGADIAIMLVDGILNFRIRKDLQDVWDEDRISVISAVPPKQRWSPVLAAKAREMNFILSEVALITDPLPDWLAKTIKGKKPSNTPKVFHINYQTKDIRIKGSLKQAGSRAIGRNSESGNPNVQPIIDFLTIGPDMKSPDKIPYGIESSDTVSPLTAVAETVSDQSHFEAAIKEREVSEKHSQYPKRLIEVDLPIKRISAHARNEKNMRKGHPWHLHIWWARRPWGACRAVELASLLPAPTDKNCPDEFVNKAYEILSTVMHPKEKTREGVQDALLRFVAEFSSWQMGTHTAYIQAAQKLIHLYFPDNKLLVLDSFAGYGAIPGEAARLGCESIAGDLNPVALLCLTSLLESVPKHGSALIEKIREGAEFIKEEARKRLAEFYSNHDGRDPIAWLWARTVTCEGPGCGAEIPLISQTIIAKGKKKAWIEIEGDSVTKKIKIRIKQGSSIPKDLTKTAGGAHAVCPVCGFTTNKKSVKKQANAGQMGQRIYGKALAIGHREGKEYFDISEEDLLAYDKASIRWKDLCANDETTDIQAKYPYHDPRAFTAGLYGIKTWGDLFSPRQKLALHTIGKILNEYGSVLRKQGNPDDFVKGVLTILALAISNSIHYQTTMSTWLSEGMISAFIAGNAIAMRWDWAEANPLVSEYVGGLDFAFEKSLSTLESCVTLNSGSTTVMKTDATDLPLPDDSTDVFFTDPPYYDVVPYADLSDLCYVWLNRFIGTLHPELFKQDLTPKAEQIVVNPYAVKDGRGDQSPESYQQRMTAAFMEGRRVLKPDGIGAIVFAHKGTAAWETLLAAILDAGFIVTASWPIDTERAARMRANKSAVLGSSVHIVVRPRENLDGSLRTDDIGDWRDVLAELPKRIHEWMPRLAQEGVVGADAIFSCLGPALEVYSRYSSVEKASGEKVELKEYLEEVWAAVSREALNMIFEGADASGFEEDARLTAMWLWTLRTAVNGNNNADENDSQTKSLPGYSLEYDAARKIAQGLGAHLEKLSHLVEVKGNAAMLLSAGARTRYLFGKDTGDAPKGRKKKSKQQKFEFMDEVKNLESASGDWAGEFSGRPGSTVLDQLHQSMILFGAGRGEAMKRFLGEEGVGRNPLFWRLAQALSALYPTGTEEKRWVDGVLARKKGLGF